MFGMITAIPYIKRLDVTERLPYQTGGPLRYTGVTTKPLLRRPIGMPQAIDGDGGDTSFRRGRRRRGGVLDDTGAVTPIAPIVPIAPGAPGMPIIADSGVSGGGSITATPDAGFTIAGLPFLPIAIAGLAVVLLMKK